MKKLFILFFIAFTSLAFAASLCCVAPVLAVLAGSSSLASSFSWLAPYHNYLVVFTILVLVYAWYDKLKQSKALDCACDESGFFTGKTFLAMVTVFVVVMLSFPQWGNKVFPSAPTAKSSAIGVCDTNITEKPVVQTVNWGNKVFSSSPTAKSSTIGVCDTNTTEKPVKQTVNIDDLPVLAYMNDEKENPTSSGQVAYSERGYETPDEMMAAQARRDVKEMSPADVSSSLSLEIKEYNQAKELFKNKEYQKAYDLFYKLFEKNLEDPNINFYLGRSAYMLQHFELAIAAYERVLMSDPKSVRSNLEIAKCYFELKDYKESKKIFLETLSDQMPTNVQQNIRKYLKALDSKTKKNFISGSVVLGLNYDSNIYSRANDDIFTIPGIIDNITNQPIKTTNSTPEASGYAHQQAVSLNHLYKFDNEINFKNNFVFFAKTIVEHHNRDIMLAQYSPAVSVTYNHNKILVDYALLFSKIWLGSKSTMTYYGINPRLTYVFDAYNILSSSFKYQEKNIVTNTSHITELDFSLRRIHSSKTTFLFYTRLAAERKVSDGSVNIDNDLLNVAFSTSYRFTPVLRITPKLQYYMKWYKDEDIFYVKKQEDKELQFLLNSTYSISKSSLFSMDYSYMNHISNIPSWEFNKHSLTANIILLF